MKDFFNWLGVGLQTPGSVVSTGFKLLIGFAVLWGVMKIWENMG